MTNQFHQPSVTVVHCQVPECEPVELKCFISCAPLTTTSWEKDGQPLLSSSSISLSEKTGGGGKMA